MELRCRLKKKKKNRPLGCSREKAQFSCDEVELSDMEEIKKRQKSSLLENAHRFLKQ